MMMIIIAYAVIPLLTQKENEGLVEESSDDKNKIIEKLNEKIEELQQEITYLREQQQKQQEEKFTALGYLEYSITICQSKLL